MLWTHASVMVPRFSGSTLTEIPVPCTFDFNVAATKYFQASRAGPAAVLSIQRRSLSAGGCTLQVSPISWSKEAKYRLPVKVWKDLMDLYYPNSAWLALRRDTFERLYRYKVSEGIPTWEEALERALDALPRVRMNAAMVDGIVKAVLEGDMLYPYRPSAVRPSAIRLWRRLSGCVQSCAGRHRRMVDANGVPGPRKWANPLHRARQIPPHGRPFRGKAGGAYE